MLTFNNNNVFTGYIKQLLATFNLPQCQIFNIYQFKERNKPLIQDCVYLYKNKFYRCLENYNSSDANPISEEVFLEKCKELLPYIENRYYKNLTSTLIINNNIYDSYTHRYLGNYLRYLRDYKDINLMRLYNCFNNEQPLSLTVLNFNKDTNYKYYVIPIKFYQQYTLALSCSTPIYLQCCLYDGTNNYKTYANTYKKLNGCNFYNPILINFDFGDLTENDLSKEQDLRLILKLPISNDSSIVVLEGNYKDSNKIILTDADDHEVMPNIIYNFEDPKTWKNIELRSKSQLLAFDTKTSYPFSDRLIEYLLLNPITNIDTISDNIKRIQLQLKKNFKIEKIINVDGYWKDEYRGYLYTIAKKRNVLNTNFDIMGYVDKDIESILGEEYDLYKEGDI